ncbi:hypothetical protein C0Q70_02493 [Pomacea canaliculata]|uniref:C3H1-type domain-containing protein n=1 Tax=Pomacea canaliculata TaxID=400727 RepID=A0A2T7PQ52_POMCA|nr:hypothetical protein C0Q70_02493 [Pomacea canaliculata]
MEDDEWDRKVTRLLISEFEGRARTAQLETSLLQENLLTGGMDKENLLTGGMDSVLRRLSDNSRFLIFRRGEQVKYVSVDWENVGICSEFRKKCRRENCPNFHVCKFFISCKCKKGSTCQFGHDLQDTANTRVSDSLGLSSFSPEEIRTIIFRSHPAVCVNYNKDGCEDNDCPDLHVCSLFIIRQCTDCMLEHSFRTSEHNQWVLDTFHLGHLTDEELRKKILVRNLNQPKSQRKRKVSSSSVSRCSTSTSKEEEDCIVNVFNFLLKRFFGRTKFNTFLTDKGNLLHGLKRPAIIEWFQDNHDRFLLYESEGDVKYVSVYNRRARACHRYHNPSRSDCGNHRCHYFHVCRRYVGGDCVNPRCSLTHDLSSESNVKVRSDLNLDQLTDDEVLALMLCSSPAVCVNHNKSGCSLSDCPDLHVCLTYIFNQCPRDELPEDELRRLVIVKKGNNREVPQDAGVFAVQATPPRGQEVATVSSIHQAATDVYQAAASGVAEPQIEINFIDYILDPSNWSSVEADDDVDTYEYICEAYTWTGACPKGSDCPHYHSPHRRPYLWLKLEDGHPPSDSVVFEERRLSTPSYVDAAPGIPLNFYTQWVWYREEYDGRYVEFYPVSIAVQCVVPDIIHQIPEPLDCCGPLPKLSELVLNLEL